MLEVLEATSPNRPVSPIRQTPKKACICKSACSNAGSRPPRKSAYKRTCLQKSFLFGASRKMLGNA
eukprot:1763032-Amphidinium_carterae.1